ncbi:hypothetical protein C7H62_1185 [Mesoflavibacter sp. HG96]|uniref:IPExxxVDY family protein n=1 Tax=Mesoflavibacter TaxID=444051 RepID=UPI000D0F0A06|nr:MULTISPECIES: IPExxxVDY family protein [Mesoflavibacter]QIJ88994.1 hypothetical protein C7H62_1185 [Mesoflavibacter sp. HG96]QIJ91722.1 hypothetical protein C7H56_1185 [Mesoflavibacter sp. HG37]
MAVKKLLLDDFFEEEQYILIGIHCTLEDYRLAFLINQVLDIRLKRKQEDVKFSKDNSSFSLYEFNQEKQHIIYYLVANSCKVKQDQQQDINSLFSNEAFLTTNKYLLPEFKKVNYLLKVETEFPLNKEKLILNKLLKIPQIVTAYSIDVDNLKTKNNLIFN